jgi:hypothetical protein
VTERLTGIRQGGAGDTVDRINLDALAKRRRDLERRLGAQLRAEQLDLVEYRIESATSTFCPAAAVAEALLRFQEMTSCVFDAVRTAPKRLYQPSKENIELSTLHLAGARVGSLMMSLSIPNERLIAIESDLDVTFQLVFALLRLRTPSQLASVQAQTGTAGLTRAYAWAQNSVDYGLTTLISWQKTAALSESVAISPGDAQLLLATIGDTVLERTDEIEEEVTLLNLDNSSASFVLRTAFGEERAGQLGDHFPRGAWSIYGRYVAGLTRMIRVHSATGDEAVRWTLDELRPIA